MVGQSLLSIILLNHWQPIIGRRVIKGQVYSENFWKLVFVPLEVRGRRGQETHTDSK